MYRIIMPKLVQHILCDVEILERDIKKELSQLKVTKSLVLMEYILEYSMRQLIKLQGHYGTFLGSHWMKECCH